SRSPAKADIAALLSQAICSNPDRLAPCRPLEAHVIANIAGRDVVHANVVPTGRQLRSESQLARPAVHFDTKQAANYRCYHHCFRPDLMVRRAAEIGVEIAR